MAWSGDQCWIFSAPDNDTVDVSILVHWASNVEFHLWERAAGIQVCGILWSSLHHIGDVPSEVEVESSYNRGAESLCNKFFEYTARDDGDPDDYDEDHIGDAVSHAAMPARNDGTTLVSSWLMDTGCPLDLIDQSDAAPE